MEYMGNLFFWDEKFKARSFELMRHELLLEKDQNWFTDGAKILDLACGDGRNAIFMEKCGFHVTAMDFSSVALERLEKFAQKEHLNITTKKIDLEHLELLDVDETYDAIIINHYRGSQELYAILSEKLNEDGILWINGFREIPKDHPGIRQQDTLQDVDFTKMSGMKLEEKKDYEALNRKYVRYIWSRSRNHS